VRRYVVKRQAELLRPAELADGAAAEHLKQADLRNLITNARKVRRGTALKRAFGAYAV
jgi:hypothetical protein